VTPYYEADGITIYCGDCRAVLPGIAADVTVTDPPYGIGLGDHQGTALRHDGHHLVKQGYVSYDDTDENLRTIVVPAISTALAITNGRGAVFVAGGKIGAFPEPACVGGIYLPSGCGRTCWGFTNFWPCLMYGGAPDLQKGSRHTVLKSTEAVKPNGHPCPKPIGWITWIVDLASRTGETVLDPFMGSGTTLVAAKQLGRRAIGIEREERYCEIAVRRLAQGVLL